MGIIRTIDDLIDNGITVTGMCRSCGRGFEVDLQALTESLGRDHVHDEAGLQLKCEDCGSTDVMHVFGRHS